MSQNTLFLVGALLIVVVSYFAFRLRRRPTSRSEFFYEGRRARRVRRQFVAWDYGVTGRPDYLVYHGGHPIPVLLKSGKAPNSDYPHDSHVAQIIALCLVIQITKNMDPPYGIIRYDDRTFEVDYTPVAFESLQEVLEEIRHERRQTTPPARSHEERRRCVACRHRSICEERLK